MRLTSTKVADLVGAQDESLPAPNDGASILDELSEASGPEEWFSIAKRHLDLESAQDRFERARRIAQRENMNASSEIQRIQLS